MKPLCDNLGIISIMKNHVHQNKTMHVELDCHFIKEKFDSVFELLHTPTQFREAGLLAKAMSRVTFENLKASWE